MLCRTNRRVFIELEDPICALLAMEGVPRAHVGEIIDDPHIFDIWCTLPHDMMKQMHHVVSALTFIRNLQTCTQSRSSPQLDEVPNDAHHDSLSAHTLGEN